MAMTRDGKPIVQKAGLGSDGLLKPMLALEGLSLPLALAVSPDNRTLLVADGGSSQQSAIVMTTISRAVRRMSPASAGSARSLWTRCARSAMSETGRL